MAGSSEWPLEGTGLGEGPKTGSFRVLRRHNNPERPGFPRGDQLLHDLLSLMACPSAVRASDRLTAGEIAALVDQRDLAEDCHHCPHGRPTCLRFCRRDLDRHFRRS